MIVSTQDTSAFSEYELDLCGEVCEVIWQADAVFTNSFGIAVPLTQLLLLKAQMRTYCANLDGSARAAVREILTLWLTVRLSEVAFIGGKIGCVDGLNLSSEGVRELVRLRFINYVPVMTIAQGTTRRDNAFTPKNSYLEVG